MRVVAMLMLCVLLGCHSFGLGEPCTKNGAPGNNENGDCQSSLVCVISDDCSGSPGVCPGTCVQPCTDESGCVIADGGAPESEKCCIDYISPENGDGNSCACFHSM